MSIAELGLEPAAFVSVLDRLPVGVVMLDAKGKQVVYVNSAARRAFHPARIRHGGELPEPWREFSLRRYAERLVKPGVATAQAAELEDGRAFVINGITPRDTDVAVLLVEDVSGRERRSRAEREFVANAAHELLTPLTGIVGAAHVLQAGAKEVPEDRDRFIQHIAAECDRLTRIARSLLVLARAQSGEEPPRLDVLPVCALFNEVADQLDVEVSVTCADHVTVFADADLLVQALTNLIANAARHDSGAPIEVHVVETAANTVEIDIVRSGVAGREIGAFRGRFRSGAGRDGGGFGLGLSIAEQSLEVMGGRLLLNSDATRAVLPAGEVSPA